MKTKLSLLCLFLCSYSAFSQVGIGTTNPQAQLDVDGGNVRFSDYGTGTFESTEAYALGIESDGDIVEIPRHIGLQYYSWDISNTTQPNIDNVRTLGLTHTQGIYNHDLNDTARSMANPSSNGNGYIIRFMGTLKVNNTGTFNFSARSDDGSRIYIDDVLVLENWYDQGATTRTGSATLAKGEHKIEFWYYENNGGVYMEFYWGTNPDGYTVNSTINANQFFVK